MHTIVSKAVLISFLITTTLNVNICEGLLQNDTWPNAKNKTEFRIFKKISVPSGTSLSLGTQVSRPKILPGVFLVGDAAVVDAVVELPMWMDIDRFVEAMYHEDQSAERPRSNGDDDFDFNLSQFVGKERCFLYENLEHFLSTLLTIPRRTSHACLLRAICEIHKISMELNSFHPPSLMFELIELFFTPSFGIQDECRLPYVKPESAGKLGICHSYISKCPINIASLIMTRLIPPTFR